MKQLRYLFGFIAIGIFLVSCGTTQMGRQFTLEEPEPGMSTVVGAILVENAGYDDYYRPIREGIQVVVVGKTTQDGEEQREGYRVYTDENGYFMLQNVPPGAYIVKGIEFTIGVGQTMRVAAEWEAGRKIFRMTDRELNYIVRDWPMEEDSKVINTSIHYFLIDRAPRVMAAQTFELISDRSLALDQYTYTLQNPVDYFKEKYPESAWFE
ncbi:MAG TPA: carboxypeptidase-like regulatory domain-containing protein [bacterium]|nr:carboxypeptidase-like regulatory domain-containing protein [bacterium]